MVDVRTFGAAIAQTLIERLTAPAAGDGRTASGVAEWIATALAPVIRPAETMEDTLIGALAGGASGDAAAPAPIAWEGHVYRLDLGAAERHRLHDVRERQHGLPIDI